MLTLDCAARYQCTSCRKYYRITKIGHLRQHNLGWGTKRCEGSGQAADPQRINPADL